MNEDDIDAAFHQLELEDRQFEEEWEKDYEAWLAAQVAWWFYIDSDPDWIREHT